MTKHIRQRPVRPLDAFPDQDWRNWRTHVLTVDIEAVHAAVIAERLDAVLERFRTDGVSVRDFATRARLSRTSLYNLAKCVSYPMEGMVARLQDELPVDLSPNAEVRAVKAHALRERCDRLEAELDTTRVERDDLQRRLDELHGRAARADPAAPHPRLKAAFEALARPEAS